MCTEKTYLNNLNTHTKNHGDPALIIVQLPHFAGCLGRQWYAAVATASGPVRGLQILFNMARCTSSGGCRADLCKSNQHGSPGSCHEGMTRVHGMSSDLLNDHMYQSVSITSNSNRVSVTFNNHLEYSRMPGLDAASMVPLVTKTTPSTSCEADGALPGLFLGWR